MGPDLAEPRVLICGSRRWPWHRTVETVLDRLAVRYGGRLVVIEGAANGADAAAHRWCLGRGFGIDRLVPGENPNIGRWLRPGVFPAARPARLRRELDAAAEA